MKGQVGWQTFKRLSMWKHVQMKETFLTSYTRCTKKPKTKDVSTGNTFNNAPMLKGNLGEEGWRNGEKALASHQWSGFKSRRQRHM